MCHHGAAGNFMYSCAKCVWPLLTLNRCFVHQIPACKKSPNLKPKNLLTFVYINLHHTFQVQLTTKISMSNTKSHVKWVPCHQGMAHPQVVDEGDGFQIWRVAANISHKQLWTVNRRWSFQLRGWAGADSPPPPS
jgi:hypothetical protein